MKSRMGWALLFACLFGSSVLQAEPTPRETLLALSKADNTLAIVDPSSLKVVARLPSGPDPHEVVASPDGKTAWISNYGGGRYNTLTVVDLTAQETMPAIELGPLRGPHGLAFAGGNVWFTAEAAKVVGSYDPAAGKVGFVLGTGQNRTHMIWVSEDMKRIVTTNASSASVSIIEKAEGGGPDAGRGPRLGGLPQGDWDQTVVPAGPGAEGFDVSPDGKEVWAANAQDGTITVIDIESKKAVQTISANVSGANRLKFMPDGKLVFVSMLSGPAVAIFEAAARREVKRVPVGRGAAGILMQPDGSRAYVACTPDDYLAIVDLKVLEVTGHIDVGKQPDGLAWAVRR